MSTRIRVQRSSREALERDTRLRADDFVVPDSAVRRSVQWMRLTGLAELAQDRLTAPTGRRRRFEWLPYFSVLALLAIHGKGSFTVHHAQYIVAALTATQREILGLKSGLTNRQIESTLTLLTRAMQETIDLKTGEVLPPRLGIDLNGFTQRILTASIPGCLPPTGTAALDSTDIESFYRRRSSSADGRPDLDDDQYLPPDDNSPIAFRNEKGWPRIGEDGRLQHTADADAREGWRSKKEGQSTIFIGYDLHLVVDVRDLNQADPTPALIRSACLLPAGSSKTSGGRGALSQLSRPGLLVLADRGYSYRKDWGETIRMLEMTHAFDLHTNQRGAKVGPRPGVIAVDGGLFTTAMPVHLHRLPLYRPMMNDVDKFALAAEYDGRYPYSFSPQGRPDSRGRLRFRGPALTRKVRCINNPASMRLKRTPRRPTTSCRKGDMCACGVTFVLKAEEWTRLHQWPIFGTTKWLTSYDRRVAVESANAELKGNRVNLVKKGLRLRGQIKVGIAIAFILGAMNMRILVAWYGADWIELGEMTSPPPKVNRRSSTTLPKHCQDHPPPGEAA